MTVKEGSCSECSGLDTLWSQHRLHICEVNPTLEQINTCIEFVNNLSGPIDVLIQFSEEWEYKDTESLHKWYAEKGVDKCKKGKKEREDVIEATKALLAALRSKRTQWNHILLVLPLEAHEDHVSAINEFEEFEAPIKSFYLAKTFEGVHGLVSIAHGQIFTLISS